MFSDNPYDENIVEGLRRAETRQDLVSVLREITLKLGFSAFVFTFFMPLDFERPFLVELSSGNEPWIERYLSRVDRNANPIMRKARLSTISFAWDQLGHQSRSDSEFMNDLRRAGAGDGVTVPVSVTPFGQGHLTLGRDEEIKTDWMIRNQLLSLTTWYAQRVTEKARELALASVARGSLPASNLTNRERDCLRMTANGFDGADIARCLNVSRHTVKFHLKQSMRKLNVTSREAAITRALLSGEINCHLVPAQSTLG